MSGDPDLYAEFGLGVRWIAPDPDGSWRPSDSDNGLYAALLPAAQGEDAIVDLVAWPLVGNGTPWWLRLGRLAWLGALELEAAERDKRPVDLVATPRDWLRARGRAVCLLDWRQDLRALFEFVPVVRCRGEGLRARFEKTLKAQAKPRFKVA